MVIIAGTGLGGILAAVLAAAVIEQDLSPFVLMSAAFGLVLGIVSSIPGALAQLPLRRTYVIVRALVSGVATGVIATALSPLLHLVYPFYFGASLGIVNALVVALVSRTR